MEVRDECATSMTNVNRGVKVRPPHGETTRYERTDLAGSDLSVDVCLLSDAVLQVRDVGLEPVPVADDGSSLHCVAALCPLPSERIKHRG